MSQRCFNVATTTSEKLSKSNINSTLLHRYVTTLFQRRYYDVGKTFKTEYKFNVETTLRHDVVTTLLQRQCVYWVGKDIDAVIQKCIENDWDGIIINLFSKLQPH